MQSQLFPYTSSQAPMISYETEKNAISATNRAWPILLSGWWTIKNPDKSFKFEQFSQICRFMAVFVYFLGHGFRNICTKWVLFSPGMIKETLTLNDLLH